MSLQNTESETRGRGAGGWLRLVSRVFVLLRCSATCSARPTRPLPPAERSPAAPRPVIAVKKSAVCKDTRGQLRTIDMFLPADLLTELARPLDIKFLDADEPVTSEQLGKAIQENFQGAPANP